jgi:hypothetical protein
MFSLLKQKDGETGAIPFWLFPPYFRFAPAEFGNDARGNPTVPFADDGIPADAGKVQAELDMHPECTPKPEGEPWKQELDELDGERYES